MYFEVVGTNLRILGTIHRVPLDRSLPDYVHEAIAWAQTGVIEHDVTQFTPLRQLHDGRLQKILTSDVWAMLNAAWHDEPAIAMDLQAQRPWSALFALGSARLRVSAGPEGHLEAKLRGLGQPLTYLETANEFTVHLDAVPLDEIEKGIRDALSEVDKAQARLESIYLRWCEQDSNGLFERLVDTLMYRSVALRNAMLLKRNLTWAQRLLHSPLPGGNCLLMVGAFHLVGPGNLLQLLHHGGCTIRSV